MKTKTVALAAIAAASILAASPANADKKHKFFFHHNGTHAGEFIVGCIGGSALGAIFSALRVGRLENRELTQQEALLAMSFCGLGSFALATRPVVVAPRPVVSRY